LGTAAYKHPPLISKEYIKMPTKCVAAEDKSQNPNTNFIGSNPVTGLVVAQRRGRGIALLFQDLNPRRG
jgi:hypothetical protein